MKKNFGAKLHQPAQPNKDKEFIKLQNKWYEKLAREGFEDIEVVSKQTGNTDPGLIMGSETHLKKRIRAGGMDSTIYFYNMLENFLTHNPKWSRLSRELFISKHYAAGVSYRQIVKLWCARHGHRKKFSVFIVFGTVKKFVELALTWNKTNVEGLTYQAKLDELEELDGGES
jgi:hypothetical protein